MAIACACAAQAAAQSEGSDNSSETEQSFEVDTLDGEGANADTTETSDTTDAQSPTPPARSEYGTLSGVELEGIQTHSIPLDRLRQTSIFTESRSTGLLTTTIVVPGNIMTRDQIPCTATLIDRDVIMTAYHCYPGVAESRRDRGYVARDAEVTFGYYSDDSTLQTYSIGEVIDADEELDFAILDVEYLDGSSPPGDIFGYVNVATDQVGERQLRMFHHPYAYYKVVLQDATCRTTPKRAPTAMRVFHQCDTRGGSSGSAVLGYQLAERGGFNRPVAYAIHTSGRPKGLTDPENHFNIATPLSAVAEKSEYISKIGCQTVLDALECPDITFARPTVLFFEFDETGLRQQAKDKLDKLVASIMATLGITEEASSTNASLAKVAVKGVTLKGYAEDLPGQSALYESGVSERRSFSVANYLEGKGIPASWIQSESYGSDGAKQGRDAKRRRVEVIVDYTYLWN